ncbi:GTPase domain-containing protein [Saprospira sp. CCB-QB6]|uniref:Rab family GTPase n=1 Tax=Saprospira sp. CCB-QB6 TaxID=3023936 RepID=UPI002349B67A|nr:GTPase domain-containing protein [Saprospira sp. CCB-QB6]WCL81565.1 GTPase domain-containing protein [Saprospira sp. CCB-QB6]
MKNSKIIFTGSFATGKSSILAQLLEESFQPTYHTTIGPRFLEYQKGDDYYFFVDLGGEVGQEKIPAIRFLNAQHIVYVVDLSRPQTFGQVKKDLIFLAWRYPKAQLHFLANKQDLLTENVLAARLMALPQEPALICSAKTAEQIQAIWNLF